MIEIKHALSSNTSIHIPFGEIDEHTTYSNPLSSVAPELRYAVKLLRDQSTQNKVYRNKTRGASTPKNSSCSRKTYARSLVFLDVRSTHYFYPMIDYIVVGLGLAGISFCEVLEQHGKSFIVYNDSSQQASKVAGGI